MIAVFVATLYVIELIDVILANRLDAGGIEPREVSGLDGIAFAPLLHAGWSHLIANTVPLLVFGFLVLLEGMRRWVSVTVAVWLVGGLGVWLTGAEGSLHLGSSILAFGWLAYLLLRGLFTRSAAHLVLAGILLFLYGGLLWGVLPGQPGVSWQGHLFGAVGGAYAAWAARARPREPARR